MGEKEVEDGRAARGEDNYRGTHSCSYRGGSYKKGGREDIGWGGLKYPI